MQRRVAVPTELVPRAAVVVDPAEEPVGLRRVAAPTAALEVVGDDPHPENEEEDGQGHALQRVTLRKTVLDGLQHVSAPSASEAEAHSDHSIEDDSSLLKRKNQRSRSNIKVYFLTNNYSIF